MQRGGMHPLLNLFVVALFFSSLFFSFAVEEAATKTLSRPLFPLKIFSQAKILLLSLRVRAPLDSFLSNRRRVLTHHEKRI